MAFDLGKRVLVLAPHTDDAEFGCGATIAKLVAACTEVHIATFSACKQSLRPEFPEDILITEAKEAAVILGVKAENLHLYNYEVRTFNFNRQAILEDMVQLRERIKPEIVLMPSADDIHQDHQVVFNEGLRAFKFCTILCYEMPWNNMQFKTSAFIRLDESHLMAKKDALKCYRSQAHRPYASEEFIHSLAITRGVQISARYAECFDIIRFIS